MDSVYIVISQHGLHSERSIHYVACYTTKEQADDHAQRANEYMKDAPQCTSLSTREEWDQYWRDKQEYESNNPFDPNCVNDRFNTIYTVKEIPYVRHVDEFLEQYTYQ